MNTKFSLIVLILVAILSSACGAKQATVATYPTSANKPAQPEASKATSPNYQAPLPTQAPAATFNPSNNPSSPLPTQPPMPQPGTVPTPADNYFKDYGVNPFTDTREDHLSTFGLDVDTASYTVMRRYITDGNLPPAESIRVEEFVNYFHQGYPNPEGVAFGIYADGAPSPFHRDGTYILRFGVQGYYVPEWERKPAVLTFVIDVSGSMSMENRLELVKQSLQLLVDRLTQNDTVSIVVYGSSARVLLNPTNGQDHNTILNAIYSLQPEDTTNAEEGLRLGYKMAMQAYRSNATNRVILCSDGVANVGETGPEAILQEVKGYVNEGVTLTAVGFGMGNFNDVLLEQLADNGNGNYAYVDDIDEARKLFVENLTSTLQVIARDAKVQVDFNPDVVSYYRLIGYENRAIADQDFRNDRVDAGEIGAGHSATALYAVIFRSNAQGRIATVQLRWKDPQNYQVVEINGNFNTWDLARGFEEASPRYQLAVIVAQYAELLRQSPWAEGTTFAQLTGYASRVREFLPEDPDVVEFSNLVQRASQISPWGR